MKRNPIDYEVEDLNANNRIRLDFEGDPLATARCYVARAITLALKAERIHVEAAKLRVELRKAEVWFRNEAKRLQKKIAASGRVALRFARDRRVGNIE